MGGTFLIGDVAPEVLEQSRDMSILAGRSVTFFAKVSDVEGMKNVWATVTPPDFVIPAEVKDFETPIIQLPSFSLSDEDGNSIWEGSYSNFALNGEYLITIYARDRGDNITMSSPIKVIVTGGADVQLPPPKEEAPKPPP